MHAKETFNNFSFQKFYSVEKVDPDQSDVFFWTEKCIFNFSLKIINKDSET